MKTLAQGLAGVARNPARTPEEAAAKVLEVLQRVEAAALDSVFQPLLKMNQAGSAATVSICSFGYMCLVDADKGPDGRVSGIIKCGASPAEAVERAYEAWKQQRGLKEANELLAAGWTPV